MTNHYANRVAFYRAYLWRPAYSLRSSASGARGFTTHTLSVHPHVLSIEPTRAGALFAGASALRYEWPAVVVERLTWIPGVAFPDMTGILLEVGGKLAKLIVLEGSRGRLAASLREAGFVVVESRRVGWERPRPVAAAKLGVAADQVPAAVRADDT